VAATCGGWGSVCQLSWADGGPPVTVVVRCDPVVHGPDVAPVTSLEGASGPVVLAWCSAAAAGQRLRGSTVVVREWPPDADATGTRRARPARTNRAPAWRW